MNPDHDGRICAVCGRVLEQWQHPVLATQYRHALVDQPADHPPVAVRHTDVPGQALYRCDMCLAEPVTHTLVVDRELEIPEWNLRWDTEWAMCQTCTDYVLADDWASLKRYAFSSFESRHGPMHEETKTGMRVVYRDLRRHLVMIYKEDL